MESIYTRKPLKDFGDIMTYPKYLLAVDRNEELKDRLKIVFNKKFSSQDDYCIVKIDLDENNLCFIDHNVDDNIYFLHLLLDSIIGRALLTNNVEYHEIKGLVSVKSLEKFPVVIVQDKIISTGISLDRANSAIVQLMSKDDDIQFLESAKNLIQEIRDVFVFELYAKTLFEVNNIEIVNLLVELMDECPDEAPETLILKEITNPNSAILRNIRRFRVLISSFRDTIESNVEKYGMGH